MGKYDFDRKHMWLAALPISAFLGAELTIGTLAQRPNNATLVAIPKVTWAEAAARMQLLAFMVLFFAVSAGVLFKSATDLSIVAHKPARTRLLRVFALLALTGAGLIALTYVNQLPRTRDLLDASLVRSALGASAGFGFPSWWSPAWFEHVMDATNLVAIVAIAALIVSGFSCLATVAVDEAETWRLQAERLRLVVYLGASLMVIGVIFAKALANYPAFAVVKTPPGTENAPEGYSALVNAMVTFTGVEYSIILASFALPVAAILSRRADAIVRDLLLKDGKPTTAVQIRARRAAEGLTIGTAEILKATAALVSPFLTGAVASLTNLIPAGT